MYIVYKKTFCRHFFTRRFEVIFEVPDGVYEENALIVLSFVSLFNLLLNLNDMYLQYDKFVI